MKSKRPTLNYDHWGNLVVWLPIGKPCTITDPDRQYTVTARDISDFRSIKTAIGLPIYIGHPPETITPQNNVPSVGTTLSDIRETPEGGVEIECKITDDDAIKAIVNMELTEVSPGYDTIEGGIRIYNHLAIIPDGYAKGGRQMQIQLESHPKPIATINPDINKIMSLTAEDITAISEAATAAMGSYFKKMESTDEALEAAKCEGIQEGISQAKWLTIAREKGYVGGDTLEARAHILKESYPTIETEKMSADTIEGLLIAATVIKESKPVEATPEPIEKPEVKVPKVTLESNDTVEKTSRYVNYNKIKK